MDDLPDLDKVTPVTTPLLPPDWLEAATARQMSKGEFLDALVTLRDNTR